MCALIVLNPSGIGLVITLPLLFVLPFEWIQHSRPGERKLQQIFRDQTAERLVRQNQKPMAKRPHDPSRTHKRFTIFVLVSVKKELWTRTRDVGVERKKAGMNLVLAIMNQAR